MKIGFVGLGVMGGPMAMHIAKAGLPLVVWNRSEARRQPFVEAGVEVADSLQALAETCSQIMICVNRTEDVEHCVSEIAPIAQPGTILVDHSTILPEAAMSLHARLNANGLHFVDAPITGGSMGAQKGSLTIFCGGDDATIETVKPTLACYSKTAERVGGAGAGQMMKLANQIAVGGALIGLCESLAFADRAGLDLEQTKRLVGSGAAGSWAFENYGPKILNRDWSPGFSIDNQVKDFNYCEQTAKMLGTPVPGTELVNQLLSDMIEDGKGGLTTAALFQYLHDLGSPR